VRGLRGEKADGPFAQLCPCGKLCQYTIKKKKKDGSWSFTRLKETKTRPLCQVPEQAKSHRDLNEKRWERKKAHTRKILGPKTRVQPANKSNKKLLGISRSGERRGVGPADLKLNLNLPETRKGELCPKKGRGENKPLLFGFWGRIRRGAGAHRSLRGGVCMGLWGCLGGEEPAK